MRHRWHVRILADNRIAHNDQNHLRIMGHEAIKVAEEEAQMR